MKKALSIFVSLILLVSNNNLLHANKKEQETINFIQSIANKYEYEDVKLSDINFINIYNDVQNSIFNSLFIKNINIVLDLKELQSMYHSPFFEIDNVYTPDYSKSWPPKQATQVYLQLIKNSIISVFEYMIVISVSVDIAHYYSTHNDAIRNMKITKSFDIINKDLKKIINMAPILDYSSSFISKNGNLARLVNNDSFWNQIINDYQNHNFNSLLEKYRNFDYLPKIDESFNFINWFLITAFEQTKDVPPSGADQNLDSTLVHDLKINVKSLLEPSNISVFNLTFNMKFNTDFFNYAGWGTDKLKFYQPANFDIEID